MNTKHIVGLPLVLLAFASGCASKPPPELKDARAAYQQAARAPGANLAQTDLYEAKRSLDRAEARFSEDGDEPETRDLAYVAKRKAQVASANAGALASMEQARIAEEQKKQIQQRTAAATRQQLERAQGELQRSQAMIEAERQARAEADKRAKEALAKVSGMQTKEEERGLVLTLGGSVLFASGKSELLPIAQQKLSQVAQVLRDDTRQVRIIGHTDSTGSDETNQELSRRRAEAVERFLESRGVPPDRMTAEGAGETQPLADNKTAEGRATNRRVEIVLTGNVTGQGQGQKPMQQEQQQQQQRQRQQTPSP